MGGGGSGGSTTINPTTPKQFNAWTNDQQTNLNNYIANNPLVGAANTGALGLWGQTPGLEAPLKALLGQAPGLFSGLIDQTAGLQGQAQGLLSALPGEYDPIMGAMGNVANRLGGVAGNLGETAGNLGGVAHRFGALESNMPNVQGLTNPLQQLFRENVANARGPLTSQEARNVQQQTNQLAEQLGTGHTLSNLGQNLLNRQEYQQQRQGFYQGLANQGAGEIGQLRASDAATRQGYLGGETAALGQQGGLLGAQGNVLGQQAGVLGQEGGLLGQKTGLQTGLLGLEQGLVGQQGQLFGQQAGLEGGLASGIQGLGITGLNALNTTQMNNVGGLTGLQAPIVNILGQNMQGQIAQAQANAQMNAAGQGKSSGIIGGGASALGAIIPAVIGL
jgi:hypothetical protein